MLAAKCAVLCNCATVLQDLEFPVETGCADLEDVEQRDQMMIVRVRSRRISEYIALVAIMRLKVFEEALMYGFLCRYCDDLFVHTWLAYRFVVVAENLNTAI